MSAQLIDGKAVAAVIKEEVKLDVLAFTTATGVVPGLVVVLSGDDPASQVYVKNKVKTCQELGMRSELHNLPPATTQEELMALVEKLNADPAVHGILVQLPLYKHLKEGPVLLAIDPDKDVDGFHPINVGRLWTDQEGLVPCTPVGSLELVKSAGVNLAGKHAVVVGRSNIVGKPMAALLLKQSCTVTIAHSKTQDLAGLCRTADILVAAVGRPKMLTKDYIKPGAVVIDVGINRLPDGKLCGDVDFDSAKDVAGFITPVPGGVGPMTIALLMKNTLAAAKRSLSKV
jgi:methylenetetrahydrofolate dehydrogenase (NADP+)/methenyltetrahydrofolate cyclohydrolase